MLINFDFVDIKKQIYMIYMIYVIYMYISHIYLMLKSEVKVLVAQVVYNSCDTMDYSPWGKVYTIKDIHTKRKNMFCSSINIKVYF